MSKPHKISITLTESEDGQSFGITADMEPSTDKNNLTPYLAIILASLGVTDKDLEQQNGSMN